MPPRSELLIAAKVEGCFQRRTVSMLEAPNEVTGGSKGVLVSKTLVVLGEEAPARIMNINSNLNDEERYQISPLCICNFGWLLRETNYDE